MSKFARVIDAIGKICFGIIGVIFVAGIVTFVITISSAKGVTIDDAREMRDSFVDICEASGYEVEFASDPYYYEDGDAPYYFDVVYTDPVSGVRTSKTVGVDLMLP